MTKVAVVSNVGDRELTIFRVIYTVNNLPHYVIDQMQGK